MRLQIFSIVLSLALSGCAHRITVAAPAPPILNAVVVSTGGVRDAASIKVVNLHVIARHADGSVFQDEWVHNLRTTGGADWQASIMGNTSTPPATANYIALSDDSGSPAAGDCAASSSTCTLASEIVANGCSRAQATYAHSSSTATWTLTHVWTASGSQAVQKAGIFNASSSGTMVFEASFSQVTLANTDTLSITWTISI